MDETLDQYKIRQAKLKSLKKEGIDPYPSQAERSHRIGDILVNFAALSGKPLKLVGRIRSLRLHGGSLFCHIEDESGRLQIYFKKDVLGEKVYNLIKENIDIGDFIGVSGNLFTTKKGEKTLQAKEYTILSKSLFPLPEKWHGLTDTEIRFRKRYLDLLANPEIKAIFKKRSSIIQAIREFLNKNNFTEVETPVLQPIAGGANAKPFVTHHNALNTDLYLRIAPELYLKRLIVGGFEKVYEISRCFRNEGIDFAHNPEFTQVEFYWAYADYNQLMSFTEKMLVHIIKQIDLDLIIKVGGKEIDFNPPFKKITFNEAVNKYAGFDLEKMRDLEMLKTSAHKLGLKIDKGYSRPKIIDEIFKKIIRQNLIQPTFVIDYPVEISPLSKKKKDNPSYTERFQLVAGGLELVNAFSELNDPLDQRERFKDQEALRRGGDEEAQRIDEDFIEALSFGMPPCAGFGLGIDRLVAILTDCHNIKEVILFPTLKPKNEPRRGNKSRKK